MEPRIREDITKLSQGEGSKIQNAAKKKAEEEATKRSQGNARWIGKAARETVSVYHCFNYLILVNYSQNEN